MGGLLLGKTVIKVGPKKVKRLVRFQKTEFNPLFQLARGTTAANETYLL